MALGITVELVGAVSPQSVQITVTGLTIGQTFTVTAAAAGTTWPVRASLAPAASTQAVVVDTATPVNVPITYTATSAGAAAAAAPVEVPFAGSYVLTSPDGKTVLGYDWHGNDDPREIHLRTATFAVPGRPYPVTRWDVSAGEAREVMIRTTPAQTEALRQHLRTKGPVLLLRTDGAQLDFEPVQYVAVVSASRRSFGFDGTRLWALGLELIADPEPYTVIAASTWDDFDTVYSTPSVPRTQLNTNPSVETATTGYTGGPATTLTRGSTAGYAAAGTWYLNAAYTGAAPVGYASVAMNITLPVGSDGQWVGLGISMRGVSGATHARLRVVAGASDTYSAYIPISNAAITRHVMAVQVPAGVTAVATSIVFYGSAGGASPAAGSTRVDAWASEVAASQAAAEARVLDYFDGSTAGAAWTGIAHASTSTRLDAMTWDDFDAEWAALTWDDFDREDWSQRA